MNSIDFKIDQSLMERVNPVFNTAKMTVFQLSSAGNEDAAAIAEKMGLTFEETQNSATTTMTPEQMLVNELCMEIRFKTAGALAEKTKSSTYVDLPCGYTPRAIEFARKGLRFVGLDLPAAIAEAGPVITELIPPEKRNLVKFAGVDATNYESLKEALSEETGEFCITTEGLLMYFTDSEAGMFCDNIRRLLETHGGCWITVDPEISLIYLMLLKTICADRLQEIIDNGRKKVTEKSDFDIGARSLILDVADFQNSIVKGMAFLARHGLKAERVIVGDHLPDITSFARISPEQAETIKEEMKKCAIWKITLADTAKQLNTSDAGSKDFDLAAELSKGMLNMSLYGRLDTITAPNLLTFYEKYKDEIKTVNIDCKNLEYVSSAGLRVLLIMHKGCDGGVTLTNINDTVEEILGQTGFDVIFNIEK